MNPTYKKFLKEAEEYNKTNGTDDLEYVSHGSKKDSFKKSYEENYKRKGVKIYVCHKPEILRIGFVVVDGDSKTWHTVRLEAWSNGKTNTFSEEMWGREKMNDIIVQNFNLAIRGNGIFEIQTTGGGCLVPTFGYDETGKVMSRRDAEKKGYALLEQEWIDKQVVLAAEDFRQSDYNNGISDQDPVYVAVIKKTDAPNQIGMAVDSSPMTIENSSVSVEKNEYSYNNGEK